MGFLSSQLFSKVGVLCMVIAMLTHLVAYGAPHWMRTDTQHFGLWKYCSFLKGGGENCQDYINIVTDDWLKATQAFLTIGMFLLLGSLGIVGAVAFVPSFAGDAKMTGICVGICAVTMFFNGVGVGIYGGKYQQYCVEQLEIAESECFLSWCFGLGAGSVCLTFVAVVLVLIDMVIGARE